MQPLQSLLISIIYQYSNGLNDSNGVLHALQGGERTDHRRFICPVASFRVIIARAREARGKPYRNRLDAYTRAKDAATGLVGYGSPVDELQSGEAWEAFIRLLTDVLDV